MSYWDISQMVGDIDLRSRITACAAQEVTTDDPAGWASTHIWELASAPGWGSAWASAVAGGNEAPGRDPGVITDGMILSEVQAEAGGAP